MRLILTGAFSGCLRMRSFEVMLPWWVFEVMLPDPFHWRSSLLLRRTGDSYISANAFIHGDLLILVSASNDAL